MCFNEPVPIKFRLITAIDLASDNKYKVLYKKTIPELSEILIRELDSRILIIMFNHFEKLSQGSLCVYKFLDNKDNIRFICSVSGYFKGEKKEGLYNFYKDFLLMNKEELMGRHVMMKLILLIQISFTGIVVFHCLSENSFISIYC